MTDAKHTRRLEPSNALPLADEWLASILAERGVIDRDASEDMLLRCKAAQNDIADIMTQVTNHDA